MSVIECSCRIGFGGQVSQDRVRAWQERFRLVFEAFSDERAWSQPDDNVILAAF